MRDFKDESSKEFLIFFSRSSTVRQRLQSIKYPFLLRNEIQSLELNALQIRRKIEDLRGVESTFLDQFRRYRLQIKLRLIQSHA